MMTADSRTLNFYPRPPRGGRRHFPQLGRPPLAISIHALREEGDFPPQCRLLPLSFDFYPRPPRGGRPRSRFWTTRSRYFYPRPPRGGRPQSSCAASVRGQISIHALREEGDSKNRDKISIFKQIIQHSARI